MALLPRLRSQDNDQGQAGMRSILEGVTVLDLTRFLSGPQATLFLAGLGADVIKIDDPKGGDPTASAPPFAGSGGISLERSDPHDMGLAYLKRARAKRSVLLDLKSPQGRDAFLRMVEQADVVIENFSVGVAQRLGIDHEQLKAVNPGLVYCALTGYGSTGPDRHLKAYDPMVQAAVGLMSITGLPGTAPVKAGSPLSDTVAGVFAAMGVVAALLHRQRTGEGQAVDVSMADCLFSLLFDEPLDCYGRLGLQEQQGSRVMRFSPFNSFPARDGWVVLGAATQDDWAALLRVIGRLDLAGHPDFSRLAWRIENNAEVDAVVSSWTRGRTMAEVVDAMAASKIPCSPVRSIEDVMRWPQLQERNMIDAVWNPSAREYVAANAPGFPLKFSRTPGGYHRPAPLPGEHTREVLKALAGLSDEALSTMQRAGVVAMHRDAGSGS